MMAMTTNNSTSVIAWRYDFMLLAPPSSPHSSTPESDESDHRQNRGSRFRHLRKLHRRRGYTESVHRVENRAGCSVFVKHEVIRLRCRQPVLIALQLHAEQVNAIWARAQWICSIAE